MVKRSAASIAAVALFLPMVGDAKEKMPLSLAPASPWNVHYADDSCVFGRAFGEGDQ